MYLLSINSFATSLLLICLINPLYGKAERSYEVNDHEDRQFRSPKSGQVLIEEQLRSNASKSPQHDIYHRNYQHNSVQAKMPSKDVYPEAYAKQNVTKSMVEYQIKKEYRPYYPESQLVRDRGDLEKGSAASSSRSKQHYEEARRRDEEIMKKMNALDKLLSEDTEENDIESGNMVEDRIIPEETKRVVRQVRRQRPGFFWTLARLAFESFNDTRSAIKQIGNIIGENFEPDTVRPPVSRNPLMVGAKTVASSGDQSNMSSDIAGVNVTTMMPPSTTTTEAPFKFTRNGLQDLIRRNLRGLVRLFNIEWQDALNQSDINVKEFQKNLGNQVGGFLQDNPNAF